MTRSEAGRLVGFLGALVLLIGMWSSVTRGGVAWVSTCAAAADVLLLLAALPMILLARRSLCVAVVVLAAIALVAAAGYETSLPAAFPLGPFAVTGTTGPLMMLAGAMLLLEPVREPTKADGRRLIYDDAGKLIRVEQWEAGKLVRSSPVSANGLIAGDGAPGAGE